MKKLIFCLLFLFSLISEAGTLPSGYVGRVLNNPANTWQHYTFTFTATTTGSQYVMFAFRQDPAYWYFDNAKVSTNGGPNLLVNGTMSTGGSLSVNTSNYGTIGINAPTAWGVSYQSGVYPSAAGTWSNGSWIDGAVGSYDGIYQGINAVAGTTYTIEFDAMGNHTATSTTTGWQLAVYAGSCENIGLPATSCTMPSSSGFTSVVAPTATYTTGCGNSCPPPPSPTPTGPGSTDPFAADVAKAASVAAFKNRTTADSKVYIDQIGNSNTITIQQEGTKNNYASYTGNGSSNTINITQSSSNTSATNYTDLTVNGNSNSVNLSQQSTGGTKGLFATVSGNNNTAIVQQKDGGDHYLDLKLSDGHQSATVLQQGSASHMARIDLSGQPSSINLTQQGSTQQFFTIQQTCATTGGCQAISITQGQ